jgi:hypothetical protein
MTAGILANGRKVAQQGDGYRCAPPILRAVNNFAAISEILTDYSFFEATFAPASSSSISKFLWQVRHRGFPEWASSASLRTQPQLNCFGSCNKARFRKETGFSFLKPFSPEEFRLLLSIILIHACPVKPVGWVERSDTHRVRRARGGCRRATPCADPLG